MALILRRGRRVGRSYDRSFALAWLGGSRRVADQVAAQQAQPGSPRYFHVRRLLRRVAIFTLFVRPGASVTKPLKREDTGPRWGSNCIPSPAIMGEFHVHTPKFLFYNFQARELLVILIRVHRTMASRTGLSMQLRAWRKLRCRLGELLSQGRAAPGRVAPRRRGGLRKRAGGP